MSKHPTSLCCWGDNLGSVAEEIAGLRYDKVADFLNDLSGCFSRNAVKDEAADKPKPKLAAALRGLANRLEVAAISADIVWDICEHYEIEEQNG